jgi:hypothetical protein
MDYPISDGNLRELVRDELGANPLCHEVARKAQARGAISRDIARAENTVDAELERLISKRASQEMRPDPDEQEERWKASVRAYNARTREAHRISWHEYHRDQAERLRRAVAPLIAFHEGRAAELLGGPSFARGPGEGRS